MDQILAWTEETEESKEFNAMKKQEKKNNSSDRTKAGRRETCYNCKYCESTHES